MYVMLYVTLYLFRGLGFVVGGWIMVSGLVLAPQHQTWPLTDHEHTTTNYS